MHSHWQGQVVYELFTLLRGHAKLEPIWSTHDKNLLLRYLVYFSDLQVDNRSVQPKSNKSSIPNYSFLRSTQELFGHILQPKLHW